MNILYIIVIAKKNNSVFSMLVLFINAVGKMMLNLYEMKIWGKKEKKNELVQMV